MEKVWDSLMRVWSFSTLAIKDDGDDDDAIAIQVSNRI